jgi:hypothetical protein
VGESWHVTEIEKVAPLVSSSSFFSTMAAEEQIDVILRVQKYSRKSFVLSHLFLFIVNDLGASIIEL